MPEQLLHASLSLLAIKNFKRVLNDADDRKSVVLCMASVVDIFGIFA